jgi:polar amino acid transport system permease protein
MASSTASFVGVRELVSRCNTPVNTTDGTALLIPVYIHASFVLLLFCYPPTLVMHRVSARTKLSMLPVPKR